jgi:hypothetical protein
LHGRSVHRSEDIPGHNIFKGYSNPGTGDAIDIFSSAGTTVVAIGDCKFTRHESAGNMKEVMYFEGENWTAVYAHANMWSSLRIGQSLKDGQPVGSLRSDLSDPHLHFELWVDGESINSANSDTCRGYMKDAIDKISGVSSSPTQQKEVPIIYHDTDDKYTRIGVGYIPTDGPNKDSVVGPIATVVNSIGGQCFYGKDGKLYVSKGEGK